MAVGTSATVTERPKLVYKAGKGGGGEVGGLDYDELVVVGKLGFLGAEFSVPDEVARKVMEEASRNGEVFICVRRSFLEGGK